MKYAKAFQKRFYKNMAKSSAEEVWKLQKNRNLLNSIKMAVAIFPSTAVLPLEAMLPCDICDCSVSMMN